MIVRRFVNRAAEAQLLLREPTVLRMTH